MLRLLWRKEAYEEIKTHTGSGQNIPLVNQLKALGLVIENKEKPLKKLEVKLTNPIRVIKWITDKHQRMKEEIIIRLIQSFVISQITYIAAFHNWFAAEKTKNNNLIIEVYKLALGIPISTRTDLFLKLTLHNTLEKLIEAQQLSHMERLT